MTCSCRVPVCVLFFLTASTFAASRSVKVKLHQSATLSCDDKCSGDVKWISDTTSKVVAQCSNTHCSAAEGYEASRGVDSDDLIISAVDYGQRGWYISRCNTRDYCDYKLIIQTVTSSVHLSAGEDLVMDLPVPGPVEVIYKAKSSSEVYGVQICTATRDSLHCNSEYTPRTTFSFPHITLTHTTLADGGIYSIQDSENQGVVLWILFAPFFVYMWRRQYLKRLNERNREMTEMMTERSREMTERSREMTEMMREMTRRTTDSEQQMETDVTTLNLCDTTTSINSGDRPTHYSFRRSEDEEDEEKPLSLRTATPTGIYGKSATS